MRRYIQESILGLLLVRPRGFTQIADRLGVKAQSLMHFRKTKRREQRRAASKIAYRLAANFDAEFLEFLLNDDNFDAEGVFLSERFRERSTNPTADYRCC